MFEQREGAVAPFVWRERVPELPKLGSSWSWGGRREPGGGWRTGIWGSRVEWWHGGGQTDRQGANEGAGGWKEGVLVNSGPVGAIGGVVQMVQPAVSRCGAGSVNICKRWGSPQHHSTASVFFSASEMEGCCDGQRRAGLPVSSGQDRLTSAEQTSSVTRVFTLLYHALFSVTDRCSLTSKVQMLHLWLFPDEHFCCSFQYFLCWSCFWSQYASAFTEKRLITDTYWCLLCSDSVIIKLKSTEVTSTQKAQANTYKHVYVVGTLLIS